MRLNTHVRQTGWLLLAVVALLGTWSQILDYLELSFLDAQRQFWRTPLIRCPWSRCGPLTVAPRLPSPTTQIGPLHRFQVPTAPGSGCWTRRSLRDGTADIALSV